MKIFLKTLKGDKYEFEVQTEDTVLSLKQRVKETQGHEIEQQKLIAAGRIMEDARQLTEYNIKEGDNIVIMVAKPKPQPKVAVESSSPPQSSEPAPVAAAPLAASSPQPLSGPEFEAAVQRVMELGLPRDQVEAALRATRGNPDLAIEVLMGGGIMQEEEMEEGGELGEAGGNPFQFLQGNPAMARIRQAIQQNPSPALVQNLMQQIAATNPELSQMINAYPREFMEFLLQPAGPQVDPSLISQLPRSAGSNQIQLAREEEVDAVKNLASLGFSEDDALEAYLSCDKNEAMAASLLFESYTPLSSQSPAHGAPRQDQPPS